MVLYTSNSPISPNKIEGISLFSVLNVIFFSTALKLEIQAATFEEATLIVTIARLYALQHTDLRHQVVDMPKNRCIIHSSYEISVNKYGKKTSKKACRMSFKSLEMLRSLYLVITLEIVLRMQILTLQRVQRAAKMLEDTWLCTTKG